MMELSNVGPGYVSCIKFNGLPILPPVLNDARRCEMQHYKQLAVLIEEKLRRLSSRQNSEKRSSVDSGVVISSSSDATGGTEIKIPTLEHKMSVTKPSDDLEVGGVNNQKPDRTATDILTDSKNYIYYNSALSHTRYAQQLPSQEKGGIINTSTEAPSVGIVTKLIDKDNNSATERDHQNNNTESTATTVHSEERNKVPEIVNIVKPGNCEKLLVNLSEQIFPSEKVQHSRYSVSGNAPSAVGSQEKSTESMADVESDVHFGANCQMCQEYSPMKEMSEMAVSGISAENGNFAQTTPNNGWHNLVSSSEVNLEASLEEEGKSESEVSIISPASNVPESDRRDHAAYRARVTSNENILHCEKSEVVPESLPPQISSDSELRFKPWSSNSQVNLVSVCESVRSIGEVSPYQHGSVLDDQLTHTQDHLDETSCSPTVTVSTDINQYIDTTLSCSSQSSPTQKCPPDCDRMSLTLESFLRDLNLEDLRLKRSGRSLNSLNKQNNTSSDEANEILREKRDTSSDISTTFTQSLSCDELCVADLASKVIVPTQTEENLKEGELPSVNVTSKFCNGTESVISQSNTHQVGVQHINVSGQGDVITYTEDTNVSNTNLENSETKSAVDGQLTPPRLVRQNSYTLEGPSPVLIAHMERQKNVTDLQHSGKDSQSANSSPRQGRKNWNLAEAKSNWESARGRNNSVFKSPPTRLQKTNSRSSVFQIHPLHPHSSSRRKCLHSANISLPTTSVSSPTRKQVFYASTDCLLASVSSECLKMSRQNKKCSSVPNSPSTTFHRNMNSVAAPSRLQSSPSRKNLSTVKKISKHMNTTMPCLKPRSNHLPNKQVDLKELFSRLQAEHSRQMADLLARQQAEQQLMKEAFLRQQSHLMIEVSAFFKSSGSINVSSEVPECCEHPNDVSIDGKSEPSELGDIPPVPDLSSRLLKVEDLESEPEFAGVYENKLCTRQVFPKDPMAQLHPKDPVQLLLFNKAATRIQAAIRGYLTRRLLRTEHVQVLIRTISDTLLCGMQLHHETDQEVRPEDVELHRRLLKQLTAACYALHDVFFSLPVAEQMIMIATDREKKRNRASRPTSARSFISTATQKALQRKQQLGSRASSVTSPSSSRSGSSKSGRRTWQSVEMRSRAKSFSMVEPSDTVPGCLTRQRTCSQSRMTQSLTTPRRPWR